MKLMHIILLGLVSFASAQRWVQVWSDEFDGNSVDRNKWRFDTGNGGWGNNELEFYTDRSQNAYVQNGQLTIQALREDYGGSHYTSARMLTHGHFSIMYGKFEMRAKLPYGQGIWPAFWLLGDDIYQVGWPACGEIDIMELIGRDPENVYSSLHAPAYDKTGGYHLPGGFHNDFHTYAVNWQPDYIQFFVDGNNYHTIRKEESGGHWPFQKNFFILLNLAVGGNWPGNPDHTTQFPQHYVIDYVRVYEIAWNENEAGEKFLE